MEYDLTTTQVASGASEGFETSTNGQISVTFNIVSISGSGVNIQFTIEASDDGLSWNSVHDTRRFTDTGVQRLSGVRISSKFFRYKWTINGTSPSIGFSVTCTLKNYSPTRTASQFRYDDMNLKINASVSSMFSAFSNTEVSVQIVREDIIAQDAVIQVQKSNDGIFWDDTSGTITISPGQTTSMDITGNSYRFFRVITRTPVTLSGVATAHVLWNSTGG